MRLRRLRSPPLAGPEFAAPSIAIRHPRYIESENILFALRPLDVATEDDEVDALAGQTYENVNEICGIHHATALVAGQIIAGNSFDAFLSYDREGQQPVRIGSQGILIQQTYYLQVPGTDEATNESTDYGIKPYPITPCFYDWRFPHGNLPEPWASLPDSRMMTEPSPASNSRCIVSTSCFPNTEFASVIPRWSTTATWFKMNNMRIYAESAPYHAAMDTPHNCITLRADLRRDFEGAAFAIVPKPTGSGATDAGHSLAVHFFYTASGFRASAIEFHNQVVHSPDVPKEYLFAKFAYTIFGLLREFVSTGTRRRLFGVYRDQVDWKTDIIILDHIRRRKYFENSGEEDGEEEEQQRSTRTRQWVLADSADSFEHEELTAKRRRVGGDEIEEDEAMLSSAYGERAYHLG